MGDFEPATCRLPIDLTAAERRRQTINAIHLWAHRLTLFTDDPIPFIPANQWRRVILEGLHEEVAA